MTPTAMIVILSLVVSNSTYQAMTAVPDWSAAFDRSYFGAMAIFIFAVTLHFTKAKNK